MRVSGDAVSAAGGGTGGPVSAAFAPDRRVPGGSSRPAALRPARSTPILRLRRTNSTSAGFASRGAHLRRSRIRGRRQRARQRQPVARRVPELPEDQADPGSRRQVQDPLRSRPAHERVQQQLHRAIAHRHADRTGTRQGGHGPRPGRGDRLRYQGGWFLHDGDNSLFVEDLEEQFSRGAAGQHDCRTRGADALGADPRAAGCNSGPISPGTVDDGLFGMRGGPSAIHVFEPMYVSGERIRLEVDALWTPGPFSVSAEYNRLADQRNGQGLGDVDLPDVIAQAGIWRERGP